MKIRKLLPVAGQLVGALLVVTAVAVLAGLWWGLGLAGVALLAVGVLAETGAL